MSAMRRRCRKWFILIRSIPDGLIQRFPAALTRIEDEAFAGTAFVAVEIPASVTYIADNAFTGSKIRLIEGCSEYVRQYADDHKMLYRKK